MDPEELPKKKPDIVIGEPLDAVSIAELEARIETLQAEIARIGTAIAAKRASKSAADAFFRS
jgi:uncharacterized small protein (DUF1192 family)